MAKKMITRTVVGTEVKVMAINANKEVVEPSFTLGKVFEKGEEDKALRAVKKAYESNDLKFASVVSLKKTVKLYGLDEAKFMELAVELDPKTRKPLE